MKKIIRKYMVWALVMGMGGVAFAAYMYNKPHKNIARTQPDFSITATDIYREFDEEEPLANHRYLNKVIAVKGQLSAIESNDIGNTVVVLETGSAMGGVRCTLENGQVQQIAALQTGEEIEVKGICTGMLLDVVLVQGVLLTP